MLNLSKRTNRRGKSSEDICTEIKERNSLPGRWCQERTMTVIEKDNLIMEAMIQDNEVVLKKELKHKGKGWECGIQDGRRGWVRLRKLTPRECFRLMGVSEENIDKLLNAGISDSQLYKLAGNSIVVQWPELRNIAE